MDGVIISPETTPALQQWELITGFLLPLVISLVIQSGWSQRAQALAAFAVSIIVTVLQLFLRGDLTNVSDPITSVLTVFALSIAFYKGLWRPTGVSPAIETATSAQSPARVRHGQ